MNKDRIKEINQEIKMNKTINNKTGNSEDNKDSKIEMEGNQIDQCSLGDGYPKISLDYGKRFLFKSNFFCIQDNS